MSPIDESLRRLRETDGERTEREESERSRRAAWYVLAVALALAVVVVGVLTW